MTHRGMVTFKPLEQLREAFFGFYVTSKDGHVVLVEAAKNVLVACPLEEREHRNVRQLLRQGATIETLLVTYDRAEREYRQRVLWLLLESGRTFAAAHDATLQALHPPHIAFLEAYATETARQLELRLAMPTLHAAFALYVIDTRRVRF